MGTGRRPWDLVIFDCDGVLIDSEPVHDRIFAEVASALGLTLSPREVAQRFRGLSMSASAAIIEQLLGRALPIDFPQEIERRAASVYRSELRPVPGIFEALEQILLPSCVASSGRMERVESCLRLVGLFERFRGRIFSGQKVERGKPFPDLFLHAAATLGVAPERCVIVEDSVFGVQAGVAAGMKVFGYAADINPTLLAEHGAHPFSDMRDLPALVHLGGELPSEPIDTGV